MLLGTLSRGLHCGLLLGLLLGGLLRCVLDDSRRLSRPLASDVVGINVGRRTNRNMAFYQCQNAAVTNAKAIIMIGECVKMRLFYLQIGAPMCRYKDSPPGPTGAAAASVAPRRVGSV